MRSWSSNCTEEFMKRLFPYIFTLLLFVVSFSACANDGDTLSEIDRNLTAVVLAQTIIAQQEQPTQPLATSTSLPPRDTGEFQPPVSTPSTNVIFRDDFNGQLDSSWFWENEIVEQWTITNQGWLKITADDDGLKLSGAQNNLLWHGIPVGNFEFSTHIILDPDSTYQRGGILIFGNNQNYVFLNRGYCDHIDCGETKNAVIMEYQINGIWWFASIPVTETDVYLKLRINRGEITASYSTNGADWIDIYDLVVFFDFDRIGIGVSNGDLSSIDDDLVVEFDYFEVIQ